MSSFYFRHFRAKMKTSPRSPYGFEEFQASGLKIGWHLFRRFGFENVETQPPLPAQQGCALARGAKRKGKRPKQTSGPMEQHSEKIGGGNPPVNVVIYVTTVVLALRMGGGEGPGYLSLARESSRVCLPADRAILEKHCLRRFKPRDCRFFRK